MVENTPSRKLRPVSLSDQACDFIKNYIAEQRLKPGDRLPSEGELAGMLGVNRLTVRMALQRLNTLGLIETRVGDGSYVSSFSIMPYLREIYDVYFTSANMEEVSALRILIETESAHQFLLRATEDEMAALHRQLERYLSTGRAMLEAPADQAALREYVDQDIAFHSMICEGSGNSLFRDLFALMTPLIRQHIEKNIAERTADTPPQLRNLEKDPHILLMDALEARDWPRCQEIYPLVIE